MTNGATGTWNKSESGHPGIFDFEGIESYLFYQGNNDGGKTWWLSQIQIYWSATGPSKTPVTALKVNYNDDLFSVLVKNDMLEITVAIAPPSKLEIINIDGTAIKEYGINSNEKK